jgi:acetyl esterase/lipase
MKLLTVLLAATLVPTTLAAQTPAPKPNIAPGSIAATPIPIGYTAVERLWPGNAPGAIGDTYDDIPVLYTYPAAGPGPHSAVIVLPGGGYNHLVTQQEGAAEAKWLSAHGIDAFVLIYRLSPRYMYPAAMLDGMRAVRFVRAHAARWNIRADAIGVWGFSAGGHLSGYLATVDPRGDPRFPAGQTYDQAASHDAIDALSARPDFAIISYGRVDLDPAIPGTFGMEAITGKNAPQTLVDSIDPIKHVTAQSSPCFIYATERDEKVDSQNATLFFNALQKAGVAAELHVFELGPHGTHMGADQPKYPELAVTPGLIAHWLQLHGWTDANVTP